MSASEDGQMILWDIVYGTIKDTFSFHEDKVCDFQITPDGKICISASNNEIIIWRLLENEVIARLQNNENLYNDTSLAIHPNGKHFYTSHDYGRIRFWDLENLSRPISETETEYNEADYKYRLEVTSDGRFLLCIKDNSSFKIINLGNDNVYTNHRSLITDKYSTIYNPNNEQFISSSENGSVNIYNNKNEWVKYENEIKGLLCDVSSDMKSALFVRKDVLFVADLTKLRVVAKYYGDRVFTSAKLSLNQKEIIAGNDNGEVHFFSIENI
jgi:WD40 repeat protein